jgi:energy-coupling factor transporter ATP-binding protein EcfA2
MTVRLRVTCEDVIREYAFDRTSISIGQGPFNDVVCAHAEIARVHGQLEVRVDGLAFRARASSAPTSVFRDGQCVETSDGEREDVLYVDSGDLLRLGEQPAVELEILGVEQDSETDWSAHALPPDSEQTLSEATGKFLFGLTDILANDPSLETFLRASALVVAHATDHVPCCVELAIPIETEPWRSDNHMLDDVSIDQDEPYAQLDPAEVSGGYIKTRDPMPPFRANAKEILATLETLDRCVVIDAQGKIIDSSPLTHVLVPLAYQAELAGVLDLGFLSGDVSSIIEALGSAAVGLGPLGAMVLGRDHQWRVYEDVVEENHYWRERERRHYLFKDLIAESESARAVYEKLNVCASSNEPVLLVGEAGSGKALVARALHHLGPREDAMITSINCRELSGDALDFELFGSVANELSGGVEPRKGVFELAEGGTVFLEEIDQLSLMLQGKIVRMLREGEVRRIGEAFGRHVDVRVVASTHRDLAEMVNSGRFRRGLHLVLREHVLELPPLRERQQDLLPLARTFLRKFAERYDRPCKRLSAQVDQKLRDHRWQGNVRELKSVIESAVLKSSGETIHADDLGL